MLHTPSVFTTSILCVLPRSHPLKEVSTPQLLIVDDGLFGVQVLFDFCSEIRMVQSRGRSFACLWIRSESKWRARWGGVSTRVQDMYILFEGCRGFSVGDCHF